MKTLKDVTKKDAIEIVKAGHLLGTNLRFLQARIPDQVSEVVDSIGERFLFKTEGVTSNLDFKYALKCHLKAIELGYHVPGLAPSKPISVGDIVEIERNGKKVIGEVNVVFTEERSEHTRIRVEVKYDFHEMGWIYAFLDIRGVTKIHKNGERETFF